MTKLHSFYICRAIDQSNGLKFAFFMVPLPARGPSRIANRHFAVPNGIPGIGAIKRKRRKGDQFQVGQPGPFPIDVIGALFRPSFFGFPYRARPSPLLLPLFRAPRAIIIRCDGVTLGLGRCDNSPAPGIATRRFNPPTREHETSRTFREMPAKILPPSGLRLYLHIITFRISHHIFLLPIPKVYLT